MSVGNKKEVRFLGREMRAAGSKDKPKLAGYAAKFNSLSEDLGGFVEVIRPGAFTRTLSQGADVRCLFNHDENLILGRTKAGSLRLKEDNIGLHFEVDVPQSRMDVYEAVQRGDVDQCSFGFSCVDENFTQNPAGQPATLRELLDVDLFDCSIVTYPAYANTSVSARSLWPTGKPEYLEKRNLARTLANHTKGAREDAAYRASAQRRAQSVLDEIAAEEIERQRKMLNAALL